jgi:hypothetical protein
MVTVHNNNIYNIYKINIVDYTTTTSTGNEGVGV